MPPPLKRLKSTPIIETGAYDIHDTSLNSRPCEEKLSVTVGSANSGVGVEAEAEDSEDGNTPTTAGLLFGQDTQSDSQTPPASLDEESAPFGGVSSYFRI